MPLQQITATPTALNALNSPSPTGWADPETSQPYYAGGLNQGLYFDLTDAEALALSDTAVGTLYEGRYRLVQLDSGATAANVAVGRIGLMKTVAGGVNLVTSYDQGLAAGLRPVVFLCAVTPGNYCFVQELGTATVQFAASLTAGQAAGDIIVSAATGVANDEGQGATDVTLAILTLMIGKALDVPVASALKRILLQYVPVVQG